jgi:hypothetical protein
MLAAHSIMHLPLWPHKALLFRAERDLTFDCLIKSTAVWIWRVSAINQCGKCSLADAERAISLPLLVLYILIHERHILWRISLLLREREINNMPGAHKYCDLSDCESELVVRLLIAKGARSFAHCRVIGAAPRDGKEQTRFGARTHHSMHMRLLIQHKFIFVLIWCESLHPHK